MADKRDLLIDFVRAHTDAAAADVARRLAQKYTGDLRFVFSLAGSGVLLGRHSRPLGRRTLLYRLREAANRAARLLPRVAGASMTPATPYRVSVDHMGYRYVFGTGGTQTVAQYTQDAESFRVNWSPPEQVEWVHIPLAVLEAAAVYRTGFVLAGITDTPERILAKGQNPPVCSTCGGYLDDAHSRTVNCPYDK